MKKNTIALLLIFAGLLTACKTGVKQGKFEPTPESLKHYNVPAWYRDAKFGIFIHWGVYSVPAYGSEWYPRNMYREGSTVFDYHRAHFGPQNKFGYKDFIPMFKAKNWDPDRWADLFKASGARYVVQVAMHHDGFAMYDSKVTKWNAAAMGPHRNIAGELEKAVRTRGMKFGVSSHYANNWYYYTYADSFDTRNPEYAGLYAPEHPAGTPPDSVFLHRWYNLTKEMIDDFHPDVLYFDWKFQEPAFEPYRYRIAAYYYNRPLQWGEKVVLNYKNKAFPDSAAVLDIERGRLKKTRKLPWQTDTSVGKRSWGYIRDEQYKTPGELIDILVDIVSKNGNLLLNVNPKSDGKIPEETKEILLEMGKWLHINGKAIYGTRPWVTFGQGPTHLAGEGGFVEKYHIVYTGKDIRFTTDKNNLYAIALAWPGDTLILHSLLPEPDTHISMVGYEGDLKWNYDNTRGLIVFLPGALQQEVSRPCKYAYVFKMKKNRVRYVKMNKQSPGK